MYDSDRTVIKVAIRRHLLTVIKVLIPFTGKSIFFLIFLVMASPILLLMAIWLAGLVSVVLVFGGFFLILAWIMALMLEHCIGGPFWFWMGLTVTGTVLFLIGLAIDQCTMKDNTVTPDRGNGTMLAAAALIAAAILCHNQDSKGIFGDHVENGY